MPTVLRSSCGFKSGDIVCVIAKRSPSSSELKGRIVRIKEIWASSGEEWVVTDALKDSIWGNHSLWIDEIKLVSLQDDDYEVVDTKIV